MSGMIITIDSDFDEAKDENWFFVPEPESS